MHPKQAIFLLTFLFINFAGQAQSSEQDSEFEKLSKDLQSDIQNGHIHAVTKVKNFENDKKQSFDFKIIGMHKKTCTFALQKLSLYENFHNYLSMVKTSSYNEQKQRINLLLSHTLLPISIRLIFKIPRITGPGQYPFSFDMGYLKGLRGIIRVDKYKNRCLFQTTATWRGKHTGFSPTVFEFFSSAATKLSMETLFRISSTY